MRRPRRRGLTAILAVFLISVAGGGPAHAQARLRSPYLDIVWNYRDGSYQQAIDEIAAWPSDGIRERVFEDFDKTVVAAQGSREIG